MHHSRAPISLTIDMIPLFLGLQLIPLRSWPPPQFLREHLALANVRLYARDALRTYASLQRFTPRPREGSMCVTGRVLLDMYAPPYGDDRDVMARQYPW